MIVSCQLCQRHNSPHSHKYKNRDKWKWSIKHSNNFAPRWGDVVVFSLSHFLSPCPIIVENQNLLWCFKKSIMSTSDPQHKAFSQDKPHGSIIYGFSKSKHLAPVVACTALNSSSWKSCQFWSERNDTPAIWFLILFVCFGLFVCLFVCFLSLYFIWNSYSMILLLENICLWRVKS